MTVALQTMAAKPASRKLKVGVICLLTLVLPESILAQQKGVAEEPRILSIYPSAAQRGNKVKIELRGNGIAGAYALWTAGSGLTARVLRVEEVQDPHPLRVSPSERRRMWGTTQRLSLLRV